MPGRIIHIRSSSSANAENSISPSILPSSFSCCFPNSSYVPFESTHAEFQEIELDPLMGWSHLPHKYEEALNCIVKDMKSRVIYV
jgi:hypothetical protein